MLGSQQAEEGSHTERQTSARCQNPSWVRRVPTDITQMLPIPIQHQGFILVISLSIDVTPLPIVRNLAPIILDIVTHLIHPP